LSRLQNGRESQPLGIPAFFDPQVACEKVISSRAVLIYVDGWNPYHQVLQTLRLLFDALVSFSVDGNQYLTGLTDCVILLSDKNTPDEVGPFGSNVLSSFCTNGIVEMKRFRRLCFSELLLGATPGGWDMPIDSEYPVAVNFGGIYMAQWVKKRFAKKIDLFVAPENSKVNNSVTLVLRRGRRAFDNEVHVIQSMTCKTGSCTHSILTIDFDQSTFQEGVNVVSRSIVLVGVHGAGLTNLIFLPEGGALVELRLQKSRSDYLQLCRSFGKLHVEFTGTKMVSPPSEAWSVQDDRDLLVHVVELDKLGSLVSNMIDVVQSRAPACC
jgi:hypothetical protein